MVEIARRRALVGLGALAVAGAVPRLGWAQAPIELTWQSLIPEGGGVSMERLRSGGAVQHEELSTGFVQPQASGVTTEYNNKLVRLPGFVVPVVYQGMNMTAFLLVPYVGACIHVPPPPANQIVFVTLRSPIEAKGMFEAVYVTGYLETAALSTELAEVGYTLDAERVDPYTA